MASLGQFAVRMSKRAAGVEQNSNRIIKKLALAIDQTIVLATPVDTGRARSNWIVGVNNHPVGEIPPYSPGHELGVGETANAAAAIGQAQAALDQRQPQDTIYISNNVDYIGVLNSPATRSAQAPAFFVQQAIQAAITQFRAERLIQ